MLAAIISLTSIGIVLGAILGIADRIFKVESNPLVDGILALLPGSNCGQCGFPGCSGAAVALVEGHASVTCCPSGGKVLAQALATKMGVTLDLDSVVDEGPQIALVNESTCIGCCRCIRDCPTDAVVGATRQIHSVIREACTGCGNCVERCPTGAMTMQPIPISVQHWVWPKPLAA